eukprot:TRINITY_DN3718_c0_g1_i1.p1 TRINITY_DN3718_c0_g1~~TRINITY_DN3718_c0_g1_i1.p1  ORF type:complete len:358 (+),score=94.41 TRINITY_DN3718_c0_g1_i1:130-1074(+)
MDLNRTDDDDADFQMALRLQKEIEDQARNHDRQRQSTPVQGNQGMTDEEFARRLYEQEQQADSRSNSRSGTIKCLNCQNQFDADSVYLLDDCGHRFCKSCLERYVTEEIQTSVALECPLKDCHKLLSVRDMKDLLPQIKKSNSKHDGPFNPTKGTGKATERIMAEMKHIMKSDPEKNGYSVEPIDDNMYKWSLRLFNFDKSDPLGQDMARLKIKYIQIHISFPPNYPFSPPYIRVIKPRFQFRTGHVTIGGSICMEVLTNKGWSPANTIEAMIVSIRAQLIEGGARLDPSNKHDYTEAEARDAFDRMVREHHWY